MRRRGRLLMMLRSIGSSIAPLTWLLYDEFTTADAAPITSPRTCEPGPGTLTVTGAALSIANDRLVIPAPSSTWEGVSSIDGFSRAAGLAVMGEVYAVTGGSVFGITFTDSSNVAHTDATGYSRHRKSFGTYIVGAPSVTVGTWTTGKYMSVLRGAEGVFFIRDGKLMWVAATEMTDHAATVYATIGSYNTPTEIESLSVLSLPANGYTAWDADFSTVTDSLSTPSTGDVFTNTADFHVRSTFTYETGKYYQIRFRIEGTGAKDNTDYIQFYCPGNERAQIVKEVNNFTTLLYTENGVFVDGVAYQIDIVAIGSSIKLYVNNVLKSSLTEPDHMTNTRSKVIHTLATNDIVLSTHPYPALGIATDRVIAGQTANTGTMTADALVYSRGLSIPTGNYQLELRKDGSDEITLDVASDGSFVLNENATARISAAAGSISEGDDVATILEGANGQVFANGVSKGTTTAIAAVLAGTTWNIADDGDGVDSIEFFPRTVTILLPAELV